MNKEINDLLDQHITRHRDKKLSELDSAMNDYYGAGSPASEAKGGLADFVNSQSARNPFPARNSVRPHIDHAESVRETMRMFPKIMAELAKDD